MTFRANVYTQIGASNHVSEDRQKDDFYSTDPQAVEVLINKLIELGVDIPQNIIETSVGMGHIAKVFEAHGHTVHGYDIVDRGYLNTIVQDFLSVDKIDIDNKMFVQNPPYKMALDFVKKSLELCNDGEYVCTLLKIQFLESMTRYEFFKEFPPKYVSVFSVRTQCLKDGKEQKNSSAMCYAWFIWQKGYLDFPKITWCNTKKKVS